MFELKSGAKKLPAPQWVTFAEEIAKGDGEAVSFPVDERFAQEDVEFAVDFAPRGDARVVEKEAGARSLDFKYPPNYGSTITASVFEDKPPEITATVAFLVLPYTRGVQEEVNARAGKDVVRAIAAAGRNAEKLQEVDPENQRKFYEACFDVLVRDWHGVVQDGVAVACNQATRKSMLEQIDPNVLGVWVMRRSVDLAAARLRQQGVARKD